MHTEVSINVPNAPETFMVEVKVESVDGLTSSDTGWLLCDCEMDPV